LIPNHRLVTSYIDTSSASSCLHFATTESPDQIRSTSIPQPPPHEHTQDHSHLSQSDQSLRIFRSTMSSKEIYNVVRLVPKPGKFNEVLTSSTIPTSTKVVTNLTYLHKQRSQKHSGPSQNTSRTTNQKLKSTLLSSRRGRRSLFLLRSENPTSTLLFLFHSCLSSRL
jgi:hypothetical protein